MTLYMLQQLAWTVTDAALPRHLSSPPVQYIGHDAYGANCAIVPNSSWYLRARTRIRARIRARAYARGADHELGRLLDILELKDVLSMQFHVTLRQQPQYVAGPAAVGARVYAHTYVDAIAQARAGSWKGRSGDFVCVRHFRSPSDRVQSSIECEGCVASCTVRPGDATEQTSCMCTR